MLARVQKTINYYRVVELSICTSTNASELSHFYSNIIMNTILL